MSLTRPPGFARTRNGAEEVAKASAANPIGYGPSATGRRTGGCLNALYRASFLALALCLVALSPSTSWSRSLTRAEQAEFEQSFFATCIQKPNRRANVIGYGGTESDYASYCHCVGKYFARTIQHGQADAPTAQHSAAYKYCIRQVLGKSLLTLTREKVEREILQQLDKQDTSNNNSNPVWREENTAFKRCVARASANLMVHEKDVGLLPPGSAPREWNYSAVFPQAYKMCKRHLRRTLRRLGVDR
jgi:hypothetical protein